MLIDDDKDFDLILSSYPSKTGQPYDVTYKATFIPKGRDLLAKSFQTHIYLTDDYIETTLPKDVLDMVNNLATIRYIRHRYASAQQRKSNPPCLTL